MDVKILKYDASYYVEKPKRWVYGYLAVYPYGISFHEESKKPLLTSDLVLKFDQFVVMKKTSSSFIFGAITVVDRTNHTHWFCSFQDRASVFASINHFWLNSATQQEACSSKGVPEGERTKLGTNLLRIAVDSEQTLQHAATQLSSQGEQIDNSIATMHDLHNDLDVAENVVSGLESWLGRWRMPKKYIHVDPVVLKSSEVPQVFDYEMLYCKIDRKKIHSQKDGVIRISPDGVTILNLTQKILQHFRWSNVSTIRVVSPWEIVVTQNFIGSPDLSYAVVCAHMIHILRKIELFPLGRAKLDYEASVQHRLQTETAHAEHAIRKQESFSVPRSVKSEKSVGKSDTGMCDSDYTQTSSGQAQAGKQREIISDQEVEQLTLTLGNLKSMALAVQTEEDNQNEKLTYLTDTVNKANDRIQVTNKRTQKLL